jgi:uncharacterized protein (TIGR02466 family)
MITDSPLRTGLRTSWQTPIYRRQIEDCESVNQALVKEIRGLEATGDSMSLGMVNAAKSGFTILRSSTDAVQTLHSWIFDAADQMNKWCIGDQADLISDWMISEAWAVIYRSYGYHKLHAHHGSSWSGVYYVTTGNLAAGAGAIEFVDPRVGALVSDSSARSTILLDPKPGMLIAFPSWLQHWVTPVEGSDERICIAFNVGFQEGTTA